MATKGQDRQQHIRYITAASIKEANPTDFSVLNTTYFAENDFQKGDRITLTIERVVDDVRPDSDNESGKGSI